MKYSYHFILICALIFTTFSITQEFDEEFLKSLPDDVAQDLLKRSKDKKESEETQYRRPSTYIEKPDEEEEKSKEELLKEIRFGSQIFKLMQSTFMPLNEPSFDANYILDYGDQLEIQLTGSKSITTLLDIKRDGSINIDEIGKIFIGGKSLDQATKIIEAKIDEAFIGVNTFITLTNVRDIQIIVAGNVTNPGSYTLNGNSNIFHALTVSGGPSEFGSFRSIDLIRNNEVIESIDLYQTFIYGKTDFRKRLRSGDLVFVRPINKLVSIFGAIKRPGEYELIKDEKLSVLFEFSNGITSFADLKNVTFERILDGEIQSIPIAGLSQFENIDANDGDSIFVRSHSFRSVEIRGAVLNPGVYLMTEGDNIFDAILKAGGYTEIAYPFGGIYENMQALKINEDAKELLYNDFLDNILALSQNSEKENLSSILEIVSKLNETDPSGRVIADFVNKNQTNPILVRDGDVITIPEISNQVFVYGEVSSEGPIAFKKDAPIKYYFDKKGGFGRYADEKSIYIVHPNGETQRTSFSRNIFTSDGKSLEVHPGSVIYVPRKLDNNISRRLAAQAYATILGNISVSLASLSVLKDQ